MKERESCIMTLCLTKLTFDIFIYLMEYGIFHQEKLSKCFSEICYRGVQTRINYLVKTNGRNHLSHIFHSKIQDREYMISVLSKCQCCSRHQINRPNSLFRPWHRHNPYLHSFEHYGCICNCRFLCRLLCESVENFDSNVTFF